MRTADSTLVGEIIGALRSKEDSNGGSKDGSKDGPKEGSVRMGGTVVEGVPEKKRRYIRENIRFFIDAAGRTA